MPLNDVGTNQFTTKAFVKALWNISDTSKDTLIDNLINAISTLVETVRNRTFKKTAYTNELYDIPVSSPLLYLKQYPIDTAATLTVVENDVTLVKDTDYRVYATEGYLRRIGGNFAQTPTQFNVWKAGFQIVKLTYTGGYNPIPYDLELAAAMWVIQLLSGFTKGALFVESAAIGDGSSVIYDIREIPPFVDKVIDLYTRLAINA